MYIFRSIKYIVITFLLLMLGSQSVVAKKMYRWTDDQGNIRYSDKVPPDQVKHRRESLSTNARVMKVTEKEKTDAQRKIDKRLADLRKQQEKIIKKQETSDKVLLSTFRNVEDMNRTLNLKMLALDGQRQVVEGNQHRFEKQLLQQQKKAAQYERDGKKVPRAFLTEISKTKGKIAQAYTEVIRHLDKKEKARKNFEADIARFSFLTQSGTEKDNSQNKDEATEANELGLYVCETMQQCDQAWLTARQFINAFSTTELNIETDNLIMSQAPYKDTDLSLSVSKMDVDNNKKQIFLDIRCRNSSLGAELCKGEKAKKIRHSFSDYIKSALETETQTEM